MRKYWYTYFLLASLAVAILWTCITDIGGKQDRTVDVCASMVSVDEDNTVLMQDGVSVCDDQAEKTDDVYNALSVSENSESPEGTFVSGNSSPEEDVVTENASAPGYSTVSENNAVSDMSAGSEIRGLISDDFAGVLFIGDSRTVGLYEYGQLGEADVFAESGMNVFNLWNREVAIQKKGKMTLEQLLTANQYQVIHVMLGINELGYEMDQIILQYRSVIEKIQEIEPDAQIILAANLHVTAENAANSTIYNNDNINVLNGKIQKIGEEMGCYYIDVNEHFDDAGGNLSADFSSDGFHILAKYYAEWAEWIRKQV